MGVRIQEGQLGTVSSRDGTPIGLWRTGRGPSLLAVHGAGADHTAWDGVVQLLAGSFTVFAMDRRGRGASGDASEYALEREVEDVVAAIDGLPGPVHLYGHSFGGTCAFEAALRTGNLASLALYEGGPKPPGLRITPDEVIAQLEQLIAAGRKDEAVSTFMLTAAGVTADELLVLRRHPAWAGRVAAVHTIPRELRAINDYTPSTVNVSSLQTPTLLIAGEKTDSRLREMLEGLARALPNAQVAVLPGQRHAAHQTSPELLAAALTEFINSV